MIRRIRDAWILLSVVCTLAYIALFALFNGDPE